jgi:hypothetical protein
MSFFILPILANKVHWEGGGVQHGSWRGLGPNFSVYVDTILLRSCVNIEKNTML